MVIMVITARWRIFTKADEPGWASLIPFYGSYVQYQITWSTTVFWVELAVYAATIFIPVFGLISWLILSIIGLMSLYKMSTAFGHGLGFALGLLFLQPVFLIFLGFGKSEYEGPNT